MSDNDVCYVVRGGSSWRTRVGVEYRYWKSGKWEVLQTGFRLVAERTVYDRLIAPNNKEVK